MEPMIFQNCKCKYCVYHNGFPILWELEEGVIWFEIPKNGSSSIKREYNLWNPWAWRPKGAPQEVPLQKLIPIEDFEPYRNTIPYVILRDPVDRFISLFKHYFLDEGRRFSKGAAFCEKLNKDINTMDMNTRLDFLIDNLSELSADEEVHHFYPQAYFIDTKSFDDFKLVKLEDLSKTLNVPNYGHIAATDAYDVQLNDEQERYIKTIYEDDYGLYDGV